MSISKKIGVLGGGQLGKMLAQAAADWNIDISVLDPTPNCPASCCAKHTLGNFKNYDDVIRFGEDKDVITIEIENVNLDALRTLKNQGKDVFPDPESIHIIQDKGLQKELYAIQNIPSSSFLLIKNKEEVLTLIEKEQIKFPFVQKLRKEGYDGKGVQIINAVKDIDKFFNAPSVIEKLVVIKKEIAVIAARTSDGDIKCYDPVEMVFHPTANLLLYQEGPADIVSKLNLEAKAIAKQIIELMGIVGVLAVEMFIDDKDNILVNEVAPRPHNSGHHSIEACVTSQYHQHLRAILHLPLGDPSTLHHSSLINILGEPDNNGAAVYQGLDHCLSLEGVYVHLYGKQITSPFRKMGHVTVIGKNKEEIKSKVGIVQNQLKVFARINK